MHIPMFRPLAKFPVRMGSTNPPQVDYTKLDDMMKQQYNQGRGVTPAQFFIRTAQPLNTTQDAELQQLGAGVFKPVAKPLEAIVTLPDWQNFAALTQLPYIQSLHGDFQQGTMTPQF